MNEDQIQNQQQDDQPQEDPQADARFVAETAAAVLLDEQKNPGKYDPEYLAWASSKVGGGGVPAAAQVVQPQAPAPLPDQPPQPPQAAPGELYVPHDDPVTSPDNTPSAPQDNGTMNGDNNGNSN